MQCANGQIQIIDNLFLFQNLTPQQALFTSQDGFRPVLVIQNNAGNKAIKVSLGLIPQKSPSSSDALTLCLCPTCASYFYRSRDYFIRRADPLCRTKEACDYCRLRQGYDFNIYRFTERKSSATENKHQKSMGYKERADING